MIPNITNITIIVIIFYFSLLSLSLLILRVVLLLLVLLLHTAWWPGDLLSVLGHVCRLCGQEASSSGAQFLNDWVAVKELKLNYYIGETLLFTIYTLYGNLI